jgi:hypothetical protein
MTLSQSCFLPPKQTLDERTPNTYGAFLDLVTALQIELLFFSGVPTKGSYPRSLPWVLEIRLRSALLFQLLERYHR